MDERAETDEAILGDRERTLGAESEHMRGAIAQRLFGPEIAPPSRIGRYEIEHPLGRGAMGTVFAATDPNLGRTIALKVLHRGGRAMSNDSYVTRLLREAKLLAKLSHPNVVSVYDVGEENGVVHIAMELVRGRTLREWLELHPRRSRADANAILELFEQAARGLAAAHAEGVVHRDFKPDNVLVGDDGRVRVADFGLAVGRADAHAGTDTHADRSDVPVSSVPQATLTATGQLVGTPAYMAPEQFSGGDVGPAADQYAFCIALYEALYGRRPITSKSVEGLALLVMKGGIEVPSEPHVSASMRAVLRRGLARDPADRFSDMKDLAAALHRASTRWRRWALGIVAISAALGGAAVSQLVVPRTEVCTGAREQVQAVWNAELAQQLREAFSATRLSWADTAAQRAIAALDEVARDWPVEHQRACEATRVHQEQSEDVLDRHVACLDRQLRATAALVDIWTTADTGVVKHVDAMIDRVPAVDRCRRIDDLLEKDPLPADPAARVAVEALQARIDRLVATHAAGKLAESTVQEAGLIEAAEATGHRPTIAHAWSIRAAVAQLRRDPEAVTAASNRALPVAVAAAEDELAARLAVQIASHHATILRQPAEAVSWARLSMALAERAGGLEHVRALALITAGHAHEELGDPREALRMVEEGTKIFRERDPRSAAYGRSLADLAGVYASHGEIERARPMMVEAIGVLTEALGGLHPDVGHDTMNLATIDLIRGEAGEARRGASRAVEILEAALGPDNLRVADALATLGATEMRLGEYAAAAVHFGRGLEIRRATLGLDHHTLLRPLLNYASVLTKLGDLEHAAPVAEDAARILETSVPKDAPDRPRSAISVGYALYLAGARERGLALAADGIARLPEITAEARDFELVQRYGTMLREEGRLPEALECFQRANDTLEASVEAPPPDRAASQLRVAEVLWDIGDDRRAAVALAEQARALLEPFASSNLDLSREIDAWLEAHRVTP